MADEQKNSQNPLPLQQNLDSRISLRPITKEMEDSYIDYAMSVIVSRALPDVRDGLKPVHRRILYSMHELGLKPQAKFRKSATVVGDVLGKYHPHGDTAVYDSLVRMAQDFSMRYPLINGQGNFGSIDGDNAAAMRYTEVKMAKITEEMLYDIEKNTVPFRDNYDATRKEPEVLPSKTPNLLLNGTMGIAVGMATNIPPHNLNELVDGIIFLTENKDAQIEDLMKYIKGPDFPTGGYIYDIDAIKTAYATGRGSISTRGRAEIIDEDKKKRKILITEIPYQVNKASLITDIAELVKNKKITGISDIRDESDRHELRVVIDLKKDAYANKILNQIYKFTSLQTSFGFNMIALADGIQPRLLDLKSILELFIEHRKKVIVNRIKYDLSKAEERAHILEGLKKALDCIDDIISTIKKSATREKAKMSLIKDFDLTEAQAEAILLMRLQTLAALERQKIDNELKEKLDFIKECKEILETPQKVVNIMKEELLDIKEKYGDKRKTKIVPQGLGKFNAKDTIPNEPTIVALTRENYIKRITPDSFRRQHRGGKGIIGMSTKDTDEIVRIMHAKNHDNILYFTNKGRVFMLPVYEIPKTSRQAKGQAIINLLRLQDNEYVTATLNLTSSVYKHLIMVTKNGTVKKTPLSHFMHVRPSGLIAIRLRPQDELKWVTNTMEEDEVILLSREGKCIRFKQRDVRPMGRSATGVRGIRLQKDNTVIAADSINTPETSELLLITENGLGKSTSINKYRLQNRGGSGVKAANLTAKTGKIVGGVVIKEDTEGDLIIISRTGQTIRMNLKNIPSRGRATQGVILMRLQTGDKVATISLIKEENKDKENISSEKSPSSPPSAPARPKEKDFKKIKNKKDSEKIQKNENNIMEKTLGKKYNNKKTGKKLPIKKVIVNKITSVQTEDGKKNRLIPEKSFGSYRPGELLKKFADQHRKN